MATPLCTYDTRHPFGARVTSRLAGGVDPVARRTAEKFLKPGFSAFVSDGASTFCVGLHFLADQMGPLVLRTNNLALAHECALWRQNDEHLPRLRDVTVEVPAGTLDSDLLMVHGRTAEAFAAEAAAEVEYSILSLKSMFHEHGPAGWEHSSLRIKRVVVERARRIVWVADHEKLNRPYADEPLVFLEGAWKDAAARRNMWLITSKPRSSDGDKSYWYNQNISGLRDLLGEKRVIEVPSEPAANR